MSRRVAIWVAIGIVVGGAWVAYAFATAPDYETRSATNRAVQVVAYATCPILATGPRFYWVPLANAATYGLLGFCFELIRKK